MMVSSSKFEPLLFILPTKGIAVPEESKCITGSGLVWWHGFWKVTVAKRKIRDAKQDVSNYAARLLVVCPYYVRLHVM